MPAPTSCAIAGAGVEEFIYNAVSDSTVASHDPINGFTHAQEQIDFTNIAGIGAASSFVQGLMADTLVSVQCQQYRLGIVYVNTTGIVEVQSSTQMEIVLRREPQSCCQRFPSHLTAR